MNDLISVVVPVYNIEQYIDKCISSILNQTYRNLEVILVDDGSPDNCPMICDAWAVKDNRITVIHKENGGLSDARNAGMAASSGKYIAFVDGDDYIEVELYQRLLQAIQNNNAQIAICSIRKEWSDGKTELFGDQDFHIYEADDGLRALIQEEIRQVVWNKLYIRDMVKNIPFAVGKYHEDEFWSYQVIGEVTRIVKIDYVGYCYMQRDNSIMGENFSLKRLDAIEAKRQRQEYLENNHKEFAELGKKDLLFSCLYSGQHSLLEMKGQERDEAVISLRRVVKECSIDKDLLKKCKIKHRIWLRLEKICFVATCRLRNALKIGL
ncbi:glycosyltransferase family 2 protein [Butyricicoccus porcorum]|uniref:glycosyltransferase family 2 protein n=1 Tax=Butyricicoccus porcorum TaxID=1945634 RepID=UPI003F4A8C53